MAYLAKRTTFVNCIRRLHAGTQEPAFNKMNAQALEERRVRLRQNYDNFITEHNVVIENEQISDKVEQHLRLFNEIDALYYQAQIANLVFVAFRRISDLLRF